MKAFISVLVKMAPMFGHLLKGLVPALKENFKKDPDQEQDIYDKAGQILVLIAFLYWATLFFFGEDITGMLVLVIEAFTGQEISCYGLSESIETIRPSLETAEENEAILREKIAILQEQLKEQVPYTPAPPPSDNYSGYLDHM